MDTVSLNSGDTEDSVGVRKASTWCIGCCHDLGHASRCGHFMNDIDYRRSGRGRESLVYHHTLSIAKKQVRF